MRIRLPDEFVKRRLRPREFSWLRISFHYWVAQARWHVGEVMCFIGLHNWYDAYYGGSTTYKAICVRCYRGSQFDREKSETEQIMEQWRSGREREHNK